jgi:hypothetical protein
MKQMPSLYHIFRFHSSPTLFFCSSEFQILSALCRSLKQFSDPLLPSNSVLFIFFFAFLFFRLLVLTLKHSKRK